MKHTVHADSKRNVILQAAIRLFARHGLDGTTVKAIGREAGVTDAAIYKHFPGKDAVALAVFAHYSDLYARLIDSLAAQDRSFRGRVDTLVAEIVRLHDDDPFGFMLLGQRHEVFRKLPGEHRRPVQALTEFFASAVASGDLAPQDPRVSAAMFIGAMVRLAVFSDMGFLPPRLGEMVPEIRARIQGMLGLF